MKRTRWRYKKIFFSLAALVLFIFAAGWLFHFLWTSAFRSGPAEAADEPAYYLFLGVKDGAAPEADSLVLCSLSRSTQELYVISLPGNTKISRDGEPLLLLRDVYTGTGSAEKIVSAVENLLHLRIGRYAVFDGAAFSRLVDRMGHVGFYVEKDMRHADENGNPDIDLRRGFQTMTGESAYGYMRYIDKEGGELGRIQREERFMKSFAAEGRKTWRIYNGFAAYYGWHPLDSNMTNKEAAMLAYDITGYAPEKTHFMILPGELKTAGGNAVWDVNPIGMQKIVGLTIGQNQ